MINRGLSHRAMFHTGSDIRFFLSRLAREVRRGRLEVHAWCVLTTHFHLLVRSPVGELSEAMRSIQIDHVRRFNRRHARDGSLGRDRFYSKPVDTLRYRRTLVRYIDANCVRAGLVRRATDYPWGSASQYREPRGPIWLERSWVESELVGEDGRPRPYPEVFGRVVDHELVDARLASPASVDPFDDLVGAAPEVVLAWLRARTLKADGTGLELPVCGPSAVTELVERARSCAPEWEVSLGRRSRSGWEALFVGLLRRTAGCSVPEIASRSSLGQGAVRRVLEFHDDAIRRDGEYARRAIELTDQLLR